MEMFCKALRAFKVHAMYYGNSDISRQMVTFVNPGTCSDVSRDRDYIEDKPFIEIRSLRISVKRVVNN
ncbi:hypothetical protein V1478_007960 [Vespula squamosa]|uniref:Uncharacterized protein n=1 Tax=Vespula squamosa TaxID=30214 RepID=A0ABD2AY95_VESSQ